MATIAVDFDDTVCINAYPNLGEPIVGAVDTLLDLQKQGHRIILNTMRSGRELREAVEFLERAGVTLYGVNKNPTQGHWTSSPKCYADYYIDDRSVGIAKVYFKNAHVVDWAAIRAFFTKHSK